MRVISVLVSALLFCAPPAVAQPTPEDDQVRDVIARWYGALQARGRKPATLGGQTTRDLYAPGAIEGGPHETATNPASAALSPTISHELAAQALRFSYEIEALTIDARLAKARVWERGYFFAWAAQTTYERAASTLFILERQADGRWLVLGHEAQSQGIPPNKITKPMPDLRQDFYAGEGKERDPKADADAAKKHF